MFDKAIKKCFLKKLSVWLALIKVAVWGINYKKEQCIYKEVYFILKSTTSYNNNNNNNNILLVLF